MGFFDFTGAGRWDSDLVALPVEFDTYGMMAEETAIQELLERRINGDVSADEVLAIYDECRDQVRSGEYPITVAHYEKAEEKRRSLGEWVLGLK